MIILGIETTCDETGAALVKDGRSIIGNVVVSSAKLHKKYGGIVPELAAREQMSAIIPAVKEAFVKASEVRGGKWEYGQRSGRLDKKKSHITLQNLSSHFAFLISKIDAIAVAHGPGLIGSLLVGVETAKALALVWNKPLIAVNHLIGHVYANWLVSIVNSKSLMVNRKIIHFPAIALIASGAHTDLVLMTGHNRFRWLGGSLDDAAGEAFDKVARVLGLGYPGGPEIERAAAQIPNTKYQILNTKLPRPMIKSNDFDFSFSGLKTAVVNVVKKLDTRITDSDKAGIAFEFQNAVIEVLVTKTIRAAKKFNARSIIVGGGVAANQLLRSQLIVHGSQFGTPIFFPEKSLCIDNGAMIAAAAFFTKNYIGPLKLSANSSLHF